ncbi:hypothetical protein CesoFtcFv8_022677 [Champsocephalus esox]|uniref:Uncharacterized protein n=1 Tax=Champsocephalus esox TaxID=159716 RepID=A0AAN8GHL1_9TELE|nr:hypothetical protein CesoFtcFv8_022677 [Champsocephalus esox]
MSWQSQHDFQHPAGSGTPCEGVHDEPSPLQDPEPPCEGVHDEPSPLQDPEPRVKVFLMNQAPCRIRNPV